MDVDFASWRPVISGVIGGVVAVWLCTRMAAWAPTVRNGKSAEILLRQNRISIWAANIIFFSGICLGIAFYQFGYFQNSDWRGIALGAGGGCLVALLVIPLQALVCGREMVEAYIAYSISQRTPILVLYTIFVAGVGVFSAAAVSML